MSGNGWPGHSPLLALYIMVSDFVYGFSVWVNVRVIVSACDSYAFSLSLFLSLPSHVFECLPTPVFLFFCCCCCWFEITYFLCFLGCRHSPWVGVFLLICSIGLDS